MRNSSPTPSNQKCQSSAIFATLIVALLGLLAAFTAAWISRSVKISEFRQKWIDELRNDISTYVGAAEEWFRKWDEINSIPFEESEERGRRDREELFPIYNKACVILQRIKLRLNAKEPDHNLLQNDLQDLIHCPPPGTAWQQLRDEAVEKARKVLKDEWEETKKVELPCPSDFKLLCKKK
ncbi:conserved hypothetical protein [Methylocella tundrae]|uniref:Uncharacterized protein n=1 Tax=Methylocella tundrae TaxID=227605 RepID=A0A8B6MAC9_METTU|nr:conserved hypothetical protein [Methylocella tundrae]VTZ51910.1 conserved hypothetical protein [Methylocella tundrae]